MILVVSIVYVYADKSSDERKFMLFEHQQFENPHFFY